MNESPRESPASGDRPPLPMGWRFALWAIIAAWGLLQRPYGYGLQSYLFFDSGWALSTNDLLSEGLLPTRDFAYFYGLLTLAIDRFWFALFGATPAAQAGLSLVCLAAATHGVIRFASVAQLGRAGRWLLLVCAPLAIMPGFYPTPTHALEHALLINAIAFQAGGRPAAALVLATICLFIKPSLTVFYGLILIGVILFGARTAQTSGRRRARDLIPAAIVGAGVAAFLAGMFGIQPLIATLIPFDGMKLYATKQYGFFFGVGRNFWLPETIPWWYYLFTPASFWLVGTVVMLIGSVRVVRFRCGPVAATVLTCTTLHLIFIFFLFGNEHSWIYYPYLLIFGLCVIVDRDDLNAGRWRAFTAKLTGLLIVLGLLAQSRTLLICLGMLARTLVVPALERSEATAGLLASPEDQKSWEHIREVAANDRVLILSPVGAGRILMPELDSPRCWFLLRPIARPAEIERVRSQIQAANWLVIPTGPGERLDTWPEFAEALGKFRIVEIHSTLVLARRVAPP